MKPPKVVFVCQECGAQAPKWMGRCAECGAWNSLVEERAAEAAPAATVNRYAQLGTQSTAKLYSEVESAHAARLSSGIDEFDRVLGGGIVPGSLVLLGGEPGIGKSTLLLQAAAHFARDVGPVLYASGEESEHQIKSRGDRLGVGSAPLYLLSETCIERILEEIARLKPSLVIIDSVQTVWSSRFQSAPGSVGQVREAATQFLFAAKGQNVPTVLVGHVTKDGSLAGPKVLEHVVDTVLSFEGERHHALRLLRAVKHRFGSTAELGLFEMAEQGLLGVPDPSKLFLADRRAGVAGSVVVPTVEGHRPLLVEVQALVTEQSSPNVPLKRYAQGLDQCRMSMLLAAIRGYGNHDVHVSAVGGVRIAEPGADLGIALAVTSAHTRRAIGDGVVACGEVGLTGEVRQVSQMPRRLAEAARLGFTTAIVPKSSPAPPAGIDVIRVADVRDAIRRAGLAT